MSIKINGKNKGIGCTDEVLKLQGPNLYPTVFLAGNGTSVSFVNPTNRELNVNRQIQTKIEDLKEVKMELQQSIVENFNLSKALGAANHRIHQLQSELQIIEERISNNGGNLEVLVSKNVALQNQLKEFQNEIENKTWELSKS